MTYRQRQVNRTMLLNIVMVAALAGCATGNELVRNGTLNVEPIASHRARVSSLYVRQEAEGICVRGKVSKRYSGRGRIPGHVHLSVIGPEGDVLSDTRISYKGRGGKARSANFYARIPTEPPVGSTLRVTHHSRAHPYPE